jgi:hypothetical protein
VYELDTTQRAGLIVDEIARIAGELVEIYKPERVVIDGAGEGQIVIQSLASEMSRRFSIPVSAAQKNHKASYARLLDSDLRTNRVVLRAKSDLWRQLRELQWDDRYMREVEGQPSDLHDAFLYAFRECVHWSEEATPLERPDYGTPEYYRWEEERMIEQEERRYGGDHDELWLMEELY